MIQRRLIFSSIWAISLLTGAIWAIQVIEFGIERKEGNFFEVQPDLANLQTLDFSICLRCKFWTWNFKTIFESPFGVLQLSSYEYLRGYIDLFNGPFVPFSTLGLKVSPTLWNTFCVVYNAQTSNVSVFINDNKEILNQYRNVTNLINGIKDGSINVGGNYGPRRFSAHVTDLNIWNRPLNPSEVKMFMTKVDGFLESSKPDVVYWPRVNIVQAENGTAQFNKTLEEFGNPELNKTILLFISFYTYQTAEMTCQRHNGNIMTNSSKSDVKGFLEENSQLLALKCYESIWIDKRNETNSTNESQVDQNQPMCEYYNTTSKQSNATYCYYGYCFVCLLPTERSIFKTVIKGQKFPIDPSFTLINDGINGTTLIRRNSRAILRKQGSAWVQAAEANVSHYNQPGISNYQQNGSIDEHPLPGNFQLKLSNCLADEFGCQNGTCISLKQRCNGVPDCQDKFDEMRCEIVVMDESLYQKQHPPLSKKTHSTEVNVSVSVHMIGNLKEEDSKFEIRFTAQLQWYDWRLAFVNLKTYGARKNIIKEEERNKIWIPQLVFENALKEIQTAWSLASHSSGPRCLWNHSKFEEFEPKPKIFFGKKVKNDPYSSVQVQQSGTAFVEIDDFLQENEKFNGTDNALIYSRTYKMTLLCNFLLEKFPFDTQICYIVMSLPSELTGSVTLKAKGLNFTNQGLLPQFNVVWHDIESVNNETLIMVIIKLKRIFTYHITNTFMPTSTLLIIAQATLHFDESKTELAVGLLLTVLLVMYTLYQSITGSLLQTAYLKMIDYWLLFCLSMPFISFMIEVYWMLHRAKWNLGGTSKGWVENKNDGMIKKQKRQFLICSHGITLIFFVVYFLLAVLMYNDVI